MSKEIPILFSTPMVQALLSGTKTVTRRIVKKQPDRLCQYVPIGTEAYFHGDGPDGWRPSTMHTLQEACLQCPVVWRYRPKYGVVGDILWVRETFGFVPTGKGEKIGYKADHEGPMWNKWKPSIHMPKAACRLYLKVKSVRMERLHDITEEDAKAEGVEALDFERYEHDWSVCPQCGGTGLHGALGAGLGYMEVDCTTCDTHVKRYKHLWNYINGPEAWDLNPWVWVVEFEGTEL